MEVLESVPESADEPPVLSPPTEIVLVVHRPGSWIEDTLDSLAIQDYEQLTVTVVLSGDTEDLTHLIQSRLPSAVIERSVGSRGFAEAANTVLEDDEVPAFYLFCHDDVALAPDAARLLVEEAIRSNAGVVGPKLVDWDDPTKLRQVGMGIDKLGYPAPPVEPGELDQEQHDAVVDIFAVPGGCQLVRADLFRALDGFDPAIVSTGEDVEYCWRVHAAGARVVVAPSAVARHREEGRGQGDPKRRAALAERHRIRSLLSGYGFTHRLRVVPQALLGTLLAVIGAAATGRFGRAQTLLGAWVWNLTHPPIRRRRSLRRVRKLNDTEVRRFQVGGYAPVSAFLRGQIATDTHEQGRVATVGRDLVAKLRAGPSQVTLGFWVATTVLLLFGSRHLITRSVPAVGDIAPFDLGVSSLFEMFFDSWRPQGVGREGFAPTAYALLATVGTLLFGNMALLRTILTVGMLGVAAIGIWRMLGPFDSRWIRLVGVVMYLAAPPAYNALANGSWAALILFGALPWLVVALGRAGELAPFGSLGGEEGGMARLASWPREVLSLGLILALAMAVAPVILPLFGIVLLAIVLGSWLGGAPAGVTRMVPVALGGTVVAICLHLPWLADVTLAGPSWSWWAGTRGDVADGYTAMELLRLDTGPYGGSIFGWALLIAAGLPLLVANGARWAWAVRGWALYLSGVSLAWAGEQDWAPLDLPRPEVLLVPAGMGLAVAAAMGVAAFERDLSSYNFGWRQLVPITAAAALTLAALPVAGASIDGRWDMPPEDIDQPIAFIDAAPNGTARTVWLGHDDVLVAAGTPIRNDLTLAVSMGTVSSIVDRYGGVDDDNVDLVVDVVELAFAGETTRLGSLLASFGVEYIVVNERLAAPPDSGLDRPVPEIVYSMLAEQLDLIPVNVTDGITMYRNTAYVPVAATIDGAPLVATSPLDTPIDAVQGTSLTPLDRPANLYSGSITSEGQLYASVPATTDWTLEVGGTEVDPQQVFGWSTAFASASGGDLVLEHQTSGLHKAAMGMQLGLWVLALVAVARMTSRERESRELAVLT